MELKKIVHVGKQKDSYYFLVDEEGSFEWLGLDVPPSPSCALALRQAYKIPEFALLHCGFRYTLPERDEVGVPALFKQMVVSYSTPNGIYYDAELGHLARVDFASQEALQLWKTIQ